VQQQMAIGLDVINDGEQGRSQYAAYVKERLTGFEGLLRKVHLRTEAGFRPRFSPSRCGEVR